MGREWTDEEREEQRKRMQGRGFKCARCGSYGTTVHDGAELDQSSHFAGIKYRVCGGCGHESVIKSRAKKSEL